MARKKSSLNAIHGTLNAKDAVANTENLTVKKKVKRVVAREIEGALSPEQKAEIKRLSTEVSNQEIEKGETPQSAGIKVRTALYNHIGITSIHECHADKFDKAISFLRKWRGGNRRVREVQVNSSTWHKEMYGAINYKRKKLKITDDDYRDYLVKKYNFISLKQLSDNELTQLNSYYDSLINSQKQMGTHQVEAARHVKLSIQEQREEKLKEYLCLVVKNTPGVDVYSLHQTREEIWGFLKYTYPEPPQLFKTISFATFEAFWKRQNLCGCSRDGRPTASK